MDMPDEVVIVEPSAPEPIPTEAPDMAAVRAYYVSLQAELTRRVSEIETFLGFAEGVDALAVRVAKLEHFTGLDK